MKEATENYDAAHKVWVKGMMNMRQEKGIPIYPAANSTLRLTYGQVLPYEPADCVVSVSYTHLTKRLWNCKRNTPADERSITASKPTEPC